jgi:hypothetical protein
MRLLAAAGGIPDARLPLDDYLHPGFVAGDRHVAHLELVHFVEEDPDHALKPALEAGQRGEGDFREDHFRGVG